MAEERVSIPVAIPNVIKGDIFGMARIGYERGYIRQMSFVLNQQDHSRKCSLVAKTGKHTVEIASLEDIHDNSNRV